MERPAAFLGGDRRWWVLALLAATALASCGRPDQHERSSAGSEAPVTGAYLGVAPAVPPDAAAPSIPAVTRRELVHTINLQMAVDDVRKVLARAETLCVAAGGYVANSSIERRDDLPFASATLRVPSSRLDATVATLRGLASRVLHEHRQVEDVTAQVVDLDARLRTLRATENELMALLQESRARGSKVEDIMAVYRELVGIRTQIEQIEGQLRVVREQVALSTIQLVLRSEASGAALAGSPWRPLATVRASLRTLLGSLHGLADFIIYAVIVLVPLAAIVAVAVWGVRRLLRKLRRSRV